VRRSLKGKMILSYLAVALITVLVVSALIWLTSGRSFMSLVMDQQTAALTQMVQEYYTENKTLTGFYQVYSQSYQDNIPQPQNNGHGGPPGKHPVRGIAGLVDTSYTALIPTFSYQVGETVPESRVQKPIAVTADGQTIAYIIPDTSLQFQLSPEEQQFLQRSMLAITLAAIAGVVASVGIGILLASQLLKPIRSLTRAMAAGDLEQQVPVTSQDELGQLTATFNQMRADLVKADQQRKRLTADITHDLSTPLQIISGYIEMLEEGEVTLTQQRIDIIKTEMEHLRRLVGDLTTLTQAEAGGLDMQLEPIEPGALLEKVYHTFQPIAEKKGVSLVLDVSDQSALIQADEGRMAQVLKNLLENALRYTPAGGSICIGMRSGEKVQLWIKDSGEGIDAEDLPYVFDRFYQADKARSANAGKMGLGLAICKALVAAQGGSISAQSAGKSHGTTMTITLAAANS
jgi:signal transduction histidine kinase